MAKRKPLSEYIGEKFERLLILSISGNKKSSDGWRILTVVCQCDCGNIKEFLLASLKSGKTKSCGCIRKEMILKLYTKHGLASAPIYLVWANMKSRCNNPKNTGYKNYGGRGIKVCDEWLNDSSVFIKWALNNGYKDGLTIDRVDNNGNYTPDNCRFVTRKLNNRNTRATKFYSYQGETKSSGEWAEILGLNHARLKYRIRNGWDIEKAIETPKR